MERKGPMRQGSVRSWKLSRGVCSLGKEALAVPKAERSLVSIVKVTVPLTRLVSMK